MSFTLVAWVIAERDLRRTANKHLVRFYDQKLVGYGRKRTKMTPTKRPLFQRQVAFFVVFQLSQMLQNQKKFHFNATRYPTINLMLFVQKIE